MKILKSDISKHQILSAIAKASKSYWNYPDEWMKLWYDDLMITEDYIRNNEVHHLETENKITGFYSYFELEKYTIKLDCMFIHPDFIGKGFGKTLMNDFLVKAKNARFRKIVLDADPNAESFYKNFGFKTIGQKQTKIKNRLLPVMIKNFEI